MANTFYIANPTSADIVVNSQTAKAGKVTGPLTITDTTTDLDSFVSKGCVVALASLSNTDGPVADITLDLPNVVERGARAMPEFVRADGLIWNDHPSIA